MGFRFTILTIALFLLVLPLRTLAESASGNYILWANAIGGGGGQTTSANFADAGTAADTSAAAPEDSASFHAVTGFEALTEEPRITMSVSTTSLALSPSSLTVSAVSTGSTSVTVATNGDFGYTLTAVATTPFANQYSQALAAVSDGSVTAGHEEFGIAVTGTDAAFANDRSVTTTRTIASSSIWTGGTTTNVTIKAAISPTTPAGSYSGAISFIATAHY